MLSAKTAKPRTCPCCGQSWPAPKAKREKKTTAQEVAAELEKLLGVADADLGEMMAKLI